MASALLDELKRAVVVQPDDPSARYRFAEALFAEADYRGAAKQLEKLIQLDGSHQNGVRLLARALEREGRPSEAVKVLEAMVRRHPEEISTRDELMELLLASGRPDDALLHAEESQRLAPPDARRLCLIAQLYRYKRLLPRARQALERAQQLEPENREVAEALRALYLELGDDVSIDRLAGKRDREYYVEQARKAFHLPSVEALLKRDNLHSIGQLVVAGNLGEARRQLAQVFSSESAAACFLRGEILLIDGDFARAQDFFSATVALAPELAVAHNRLGDLAQARGALQEAVRHYKKALLFQPDDVNAAEDLGDVFATLGDKEQARRMYTLALKHDPLSRAQEKLDSLDRREEVDDTPRVGRISALGWTPHGGVVSPLEAVAVVGKGELIFSGNVGPVGREAALVAFSCLKARAAELGIADLVANHDLHIHFTDTELSKDGASAGLALVLAGISAYTKRPLRARMAATGEITIFGEVKPVGGIHEKLVAAHLAGLDAIVLPKRNLKEARELPDEVRSRITVRLVASVAEAIEHALVEG